jgi:hypothetical protein
MFSSWPLSVVFIAIELVLLFAISLATAFLTSLILRLRPAAHLLSACLIGLTVYILAFVIFIFWPGQINEFNGLPGNTYTYLLQNRHVIVWGTTVVAIVLRLIYVRIQAEYAAERAIRKRLYFPESE